MTSVARTPGGGSGGLSGAGAAHRTIGKIVRSESHVRYTCQICGPHEVADPPQPDDYAFGAFVRIPLRGATAGPDALFGDAFERPASDARLSASAESGPRWAIGLIYDTILVNPAFGTLGPRLSNDEQVALFSPDYLTERAALVSILLLGALTERAGHAPLVRHGVPALAPELGAEAQTLADADIRAFHAFADASGPGAARPYLHMGYLPHAIAADHALLPLAMLHTVERLERLFPEHAKLLALVKRNFAWRLKVQTAG